MVSPHLAKTSEIWGTRPLYRGGNPKALSASNETRVATGSESCRGLRPSFSAHVRWCERGAPLQSCEIRRRLEGKTCGTHISRKTSEMPRISCTQLWREPRVRLSLRKGAGSAGNPRNYTGNRGCGAPGNCAGIERKSPSTGHCFSPRSFNIGFTLGSVPSHALYIAARSSVFPRDKTIRRNRSPLARVNPPWSRNHW